MAGEDSAIKYADTMDIVYTTVSLAFESLCYGKPKHTALPVVKFTLTL